VINRHAISRFGKYRLSLCHIPSSGKRAKACHSNCPWIAFWAHGALHSHPVQKIAFTTLLCGTLYILHLFGSSETIDWQVSSSPLSVSFDIRPHERIYSDYKRSSDRPRTLPLLTLFCHTLRQKLQSIYQTTYIPRCQHNINESSVRTPHLPKRLLLQRHLRLLPKPPPRAKLHLLLQLLHLKVSPHPALSQSDIV
jgi:hypothetical protein